MRKIVVLSLVLLTLFAMSTVPVAADVSSDDVTVTVTGDGTWADGVLSMSLFPGQEKLFTVTVNSTADEDLQLTPVADPGCVADGILTVCFASTNSTLVAGGSSTFNLTVVARGDAPPGVFSSNLTITADVKVVEPDPEPSVGVPHHIILVSAEPQVVAGHSHELTATVYDEANTPLPEISVEWSVVSGLASLSSVDLTTGTGGWVRAIANHADAGSATVQCLVVGYPAVLETISLTWIEEPVVVTPTPNIRRPISNVVFGEMYTGNTLEKTTAIHNDGDAPLVVSGIARSSGSEAFACTGPLTPLTVNPASSATVTIRFAPSDAGSVNTTFTVTSNDPDTPSVSFLVSGTGASRGQPAWKVFLIGVLIIGGGYGGYVYYKRWRAKKSGLDVLAGGGDDLDLAAAGGGGPDDELHLPD